MFGGQIQGKEVLIIVNLGAQDNFINISWQIEYFKDYITPFSKSIMDIKDKILIFN